MTVTNIASRLFIFCLWLSPMVTHSQELSLLQTHGKAIVNAEGDSIILRGMGLGGWMLQEGYMMQTASFANAQYQIKEKIAELVGEDNMNTFYDLWLENHVTKADIDSLKSWGFNSVRLPMHYDLFTLPIEEEPVLGVQTWLEKGFELTDSLISWCKQNDMYVVLDLHAAPGGQGYDQGISDYNPEKPSLWESFENKRKMVSLWNRLSKRYKDEVAIAGYDLLNETNWNLSGNVAMRNLYMEVMDSIRSNGDNHIIFIEGNWFANDFTGLTPPWDDNFVYSPHKYWSFNDQASIQWALNLRDTYNVPIYFGETGENSNLWFRDAIRLFENNDIGWAWWPMKKIESIAGPLSTIKSDGYQNLLNYWEGNASEPTSSAAWSVLLDLIDDIKIENCIYQKDVVDAMFRQINSDESKPYSDHQIPGVIYPTDFDLGGPEIAYSDRDLATYHVSSGNYTAWNQGWSYRNDGVDIEKSSDFMSNGFNVGWFGEGEWLKFSPSVITDGAYTLKMRVASGVFGGITQLSFNDAPITNERFVPSTGGWNIWTDIEIPNIVMTDDMDHFKLHSANANFNVSRLEWIYEGSTESIPTQFLSARTIDESQVEVHLNKFMQTNGLDLNSFIFYANGQEIPIISVELNAENTRVLKLVLDGVLEEGQLLKISYDQSSWSATDETALESFILEDVENLLPRYHPIPGIIEAEDFANQFGVEVANTNDSGGGQHIGFINADDYVEYFVDISLGTNYRITYRSASESTNTQLKMEIYDSNDALISIPHLITVGSTGSWNSWEDTSVESYLESGRYKVRVYFISGELNLNWINFQFTSGIEDDSTVELNLFPNPSSEFIQLKGLNNSSSYSFRVIDGHSKNLMSGFLENNDLITINHLSPGLYFIEIIENTTKITKVFKFVKE